MTLQPVPFQCSTSGSEGPFIVFWKKPTAQTSFAARALTARSQFVAVPGLGLPATFQPGTHGGVLVAVGVAVGGVPVTVGLGVPHGSLHCSANVQGPDTPTAQALAGASAATA